MQNDAVNAVRDLKLQNISDEDIRRQLSGRYSAQEINQALEALKYMKPAIALEGQDTVKQKKNKKKPLSSKKALLVLLPIVLALIIVLPLIRKQYINRETKPIISGLEKRFNVDEHYILAQDTDCVTDGPTGIGEFTSDTSCRLLTTVLYFPQIELEQLSTRFPKTNESPQWQAAQTVYYKVIDNNGETTNLQYLQVKNPKINKPPLKTGLEAAVDTGSWNSLHEVMSISSFYKTENMSKEHVNYGNEFTNALGTWQIRTEEVTYAYEKSTKEKFANLYKTIAEKVKSDTPITEGVPKTSELLASNRAPYVVTISDRYCHSPEILFLDKECVLPD